MIRRGLLKQTAAVILAFSMTFSPCGTWLIPVMAAQEETVSGTHENETGDEVKETDEAEKSALSDQNTSSDDENSEGETGDKEEITDGESAGSEEAEAADEAGADEETAGGNGAEEVNTAGGEHDPEAYANDGSGSPGQDESGDSENTISENEEKPDNDEEKPDNDEEEPGSDEQKPQDDENTERQDTEESNASDTEASAGDEGYIKDTEAEKTEAEEETEEEAGTETETETEAEAESTVTETEVPEAPPAADDKKMRVLQETVDDMLVSLIFRRRVFPESAVLEVRKVEEGSAEEAEIREKIPQENEDELWFSAYEIKVFDEEGTEIEPDIDHGEVYIRFQGMEGPGNEDGEKIEARDLRVFGMTGLEDEIASELSLTEGSEPLEFDDENMPAEGAVIDDTDPDNRSGNIETDTQGTDDGNTISFTAEIKYCGFIIVSRNEKKTSRKEVLEEGTVFDRSVTVDGVNINVTAEAGVFPENAELSVERIPSENVESAIRQERKKDQNVAVSYTFDIKILDDKGNELQPSDEQKVRVSFTAAEVSDNNLQTQVYHIADDGDVEELKVDIVEDSASAAVDGFSLYTVEFTYDKLQYVLEGDSSVRLSQILDVLGISGQVTDARCSNTELFTVEQEGEDWIVTALQPFSSEEWMKVTINGIIYKIVVTDMSYVLITSERQVVDSITYRGITVNAIYKPYYSGYDWDMTYSCAALCSRFYLDVYGVRVNGLQTTTSVPQASSGSFSQTSSPMKGDIVRFSADGLHWAIVKNVSGSTITLIEQNAWNSRVANEKTKARVGYTINITESNVVFFRYSGWQPDFDYQKPVITSVECTDITSSGYTVKAVVRKGTSDIARVTFPTWTESNDQDDLLWLDADRVEAVDGSSNAYYFRVNDHQHNYEKGVYITHVYVYDSTGQEVNAVPPQITLRNNGVQDYVSRTTWNGHTYYYLEDNMTWNEAVQACINAGGHLATITSGEEQNAVVTGLMNAGQIKRRSLYLGGIVTNQKVTWVTGEDYSFTLNWADGEPNHADGQDRVSLYTGFFEGDPKGRFDDVQNNEVVVGYILETEPAVQSVSLNKQQMKLSVGEAGSLTATVLPANAGNKNVQWRSSNTSVAVVDASGKVTGKAAGTAIITVTTEDGGLTASCIVTVQASDPVETFIRRLYSTCLGREADASGLEYWKGRINSGNLKGIGLAGAFVFSKEFTGKNYCNKHFVAQIYPALMGREADASGLAYWTGNLDSGMTREAMVNSFTSGNEYKGLCSNAGIALGAPLEDTTFGAKKGIGTKPYGPCAICGEKTKVVQFAERMYTECMKRTADAGGLAYWSKGLYEHTATGKSILYNFFLSSEMQNMGLTNQEYVRRIYKTMLDRAPDTGGLNYWTGQLDNGASPTAVINGFIDSKEFTGICNDYGIQRK